ncbi:MAG: phosphonopyruvate decarboxylase [Methanomassiliicoccaceae archaeon]|nr:phosphonopyruvate decarboxylase [Methanomassiliicoccaceae archaeon]
MIDTKEFYDHLLRKGLSFFTGVPDSLLKDICACITENSSTKDHIIAANEGNAVAVAAGRYLSTGMPGVVYMQNSGLGNAANPLLSLADREVYGIPMLLIIGWRGEPGTKDEPQHVKQGKITLPMLDAMEIPYLILDDNYREQTDRCCKLMRDQQCPVAIIVRSGTFAPYGRAVSPGRYMLTREEALSSLINAIGNDGFVVSTTGKTSRELFELRERNGQGHSNDLLTVGSMGHTASIAFGMSLGTEKNVYCVDGDGSFLMHTGGLAVIAKNAGKNFKYIMMNNGAHESVGGQPTVAFDIDAEGILKAAGFERTYTASTNEEIEKNMARMKEEGKSALIILIRQGSRKDLGRPTVSPKDNKSALMEKIRSE